VPRCFGYGPRPHSDDRFPCMPGFSTGWCYTHFESRNLGSPHFSGHGSRPTHLSGEVQRTVNTFSGRMVK
jgi:hypothetical protein